MNPKTSAFACAAIVLAALPGVSPSQADTPTADETVVVYSSEQLSPARTLTSKDAKRAEKARGEFVSEMARRGRPIDSRKVKATAVDDLTIVWELGVQIDSVEYSTATTPESVGIDAEAIGVQATATPATETLNPTTSGAGMGGALQVTGATWKSGNCVTTTSTTGNKLTNCYQKYQINNDGDASYDYFYYNRWATAEGKQISLGLDYKPTNIDIQSRPWSTLSANVSKLVDYTPRTASTTCNNLGEATIGFKGFSAKMPISECSSISPNVNATSRSMGVKYDQGAVFSGRVHGADFSMIVGSPQGKVATMADYNYAKFCKGTYATCDGVLRKDTGW